MASCHQTFNFSESTTLLTDNIVEHAQFSVERQTKPFCSQIHSPWLRDLTESGIELLTGLTAYVAWRAGTNNLMPESTLSPQSGTMNLATGLPKKRRYWVGNIERKKSAEWRHLHTALLFLFSYHLLSSRTCHEIQFAFDNSRNSCACKKKLSSKLRSIYRMKIGINLERQHWKFDFLFLKVHKHEIILNFFWPKSNPYMPFVNFWKKFRFFSFDFRQSFDVRFPRWLSILGTKFFLRDIQNFFSSKSSLWSY
jgi:hypothetical protein